MSQIWTVYIDSEDSKMKESNLNFALQYWTNKARKEDRRIKLVSNTGEVIKL